MSDPAGGVKFTANLDSETNERFDLLVRRLGTQTGTLPSHRGRRRPSRSDVLRAVIDQLDYDPEMLYRVRIALLRRVLIPSVRDELSSIAADLRRHAEQVTSVTAHETTLSVAADLASFAESDLLGDRLVSSPDLALDAARIDRLSTEAGGLRHLLGLATRVRAIRDAIDPEPWFELVECPICGSTARQTDDKLDLHHDQDDLPCRGAADTEH